MVWTLPGSMELKRKRSKKRRNDKGTICQMWEKRYNRRKSNRTRERDLVSRMQNREKETMVELGNGSAQPKSPKSTVTERDS